MDTQLATRTTGRPIGVVVALDGRFANVATSRHGACAGCAEARACDLFEQEQRRDVVSATNSAGARPGETVELDLPGNAALELSFLVWVLPILGLLGGALAGVSIAGRVGFSGDGGALVGAVIGTGLAFAGLRRIDRRAAESGRLTPYVARIVRDPEGCPERVAETLDRTPAGAIR